LLPLQIIPLSTAQLLQPLLESAQNLGNDLEEACAKVKNGDILLKIHDLLEYREKIAMIIENLKNVFMSYTFFQCTVRERACRTAQGAYKDRGLCARGLAGQRRGLTRTGACAPGGLQDSAGGLQGQGLVRQRGLQDSAGGLQGHGLVRQGACRTA
jgi:hypothetical protein